ncbi:MAG: methyltransferase domain-containing protein [Anaerolineae bacterium]|nr:methyltransferase domain-containing protein [Anaerolineae bacterium]
MKPKPKHLAPKYGAQFKDKSIVDAYRRRPPYPDETFDILTSLITTEPKRVLDVGCGTGYLARPLSQRVDRVDAVDISANMIAQGKQLPGGDAPNLHWIEGAVEDASLSPLYGLVTAGESLHWLDWAVVLPRFRTLLVEDGVLAIVYKRFSTVPWGAELGTLITQFSTNRDYEPYDLVEELTSRGLFSKQGEQGTAWMPFRQTVAAYAESFFSRNGFSRERMGEERAKEFETAVTNLVQSYQSEEIVEIQVSGHVVWGKPI